MVALPTTCPVTVSAVDDPGPGGAHHHYVIQYGGPEDALHVQFQRGPRGEPGSTPGVFEDALLAVLEHRMSCFESGPFACTENATAIEGIRAARQAMADRAAKRQAQGVHGKNVKHT